MSTVHVSQRLLTFRPEQVIPCALGYTHIEDLTYWRMSTLDQKCEIPTIGDTRHWEGLELVVDACHRRVEHSAAQ